jgi:anti-sigma factor RsiW
MSTEDEREREVDAALTEMLAQRLPQHPAPLSLKRRLAAQWPEAPAPRVPWWRRSRLGVALAAALVLVVALPVAYDRTVLAPTRASDALVAEAVNDHVRLVQSPQPLAVVSGGMHEVKPWFTGRLDFAPAVRFMGDEEFPLRGGNVGYFLDRPAAVFVFGRRLHTISLLVFRADGLAGLTPLGSARASARTLRGFNVMLWRADGLGYALVSDVDRAELEQLGAKIAGG